MRIVENKLIESFCSLMSRPRLLLLLPALSGAWLVATVAIAGFFYPDYNHTAQLMSELAATESPYGIYVNRLGFFVVELLFIGFILIGVWHAPKTKRILFGFALLAIYAIALSVATFYPCDFECRPVSASSSHITHIFSSLLGYVSAICAVFVLSSASVAYHADKWVKYTGYVTGIILVLLLFTLDQTNPAVGLYQRVLELLFYGWVMIFALQLYRYQALSRT